MNLGELMGKFSYRLASNADSDYQRRVVSRIVTGADEAAEDTLYVCLRTATRDGHLSAHGAYRSGCRLFLAERSLLLPEDATVLVVESTKELLGPLAAALLGHPAREMTVLGITGSVGKSCVAYTVAEVLRRVGKRVACVTTDGIEVGDHFSPRTDVLPDAAGLQGLLRDFAQAGTEIVVLELSSYMLSQGLAFSIPFTAVLLTNLLSDYAAESACGSVSAYTKAKASLFAGDAAFQVLPANFVGFTPKGRGRLLTFGRGGSACAESVTPYEENGRLGMRFRLCIEGEAADVSLPAMGSFGVENALAAALLLRIVGLSVGQIAAQLSGYAPKGRMECIACEGGRSVFADSAYTARDLTRALLLLRRHTKGRLLVLLGSVGERDRDRRAPLGHAATAYADKAYFTADDPGYELPRRIAEEMAQGAAFPDRYVILPDRRLAIRSAVEEMHPGDTLLLAGKGAQTYQLIRNQRVEFSERDIVAEAFAEL